MRHDCLISCLLYIRALFRACFPGFVLSASRIGSAAVKCVAAGLKIAACCHGRGIIITTLIFQTRLSGLLCFFVRVLFSPGPALR